MSHRKTLARFAAGASLMALSAWLLIGNPAYAVEQSAILQGHVENAVPGSKIVAVNKNTGARVEVAVRSDGSYIIVGLRPGDYDVTAGKGKQGVVLRVGSTSTLDFNATETTETVVVSGYRTADQLGGHEVHTAEIGTSISQVEIENLPQLDRNFLSFAATAPGIVLSTDRENKQFRAGASSSNEINVFIDGQSMKNQVIQGGVAGQDSSRGNPFPMLAIDEYKVSTQNFKAEYEQAGSAIITAVTKTGGDEFHGDVFEEYQSKEMISQDYYDRGNPKPNYSRHQYGLDFSGPIIEGKLHFFVAFEATDELRAGDAYSFNSYAPSSLQALNGTTSPKTFHQKMPFAKFTWDVNDNNTLELALMDREESDKRGFGGSTTYSAGSNLNQFVRQGVLTWKHREENILNEMSFELQSYHWKQSNIDDSPNVTLVNFALSPTCDTCNVVASMGGAAYHQVKSQDNFTFKDNLTYTGIDWYGQHIIKAGIKIAHYSYEAIEALHQYYYDVATYDMSSSSNTPIAALVNVGSPDLKTTNMELGAFVQDDWTVNQHLTINMGVRWDYETNMFNEDYITPSDVASAIRASTAFINAGFNPEDYISNGGNRTATAGMFQPRLSASYDINGDGQTVVFAGAGRYYDRTIYDETQLEYRRAYASQYHVQFSSGLGSVAWNSSYLDAATLETLGSVSGSREIFALKNNTKVPYNDQYDIGIRQRFGDYQFGATFSHIEGYHIFTWMLGDRQDDGSWCSVSGYNASYSCGSWGNALTGFGNFIISNDTGRSHYNAVYLTASKEFSDASPWGFTSTLTIANARTLGSGSEWAFDYATPADEGWHPSEGVDRYRWVTSAIVGGPWGTTFSGLLTLASGAPFGMADCSQSVCKLVEYKYYPKGMVNYKQLDLRIAKTFETWEGQSVTLDAQVYNVFDWVNKTWSQWGGGYSSSSSGPSLAADQATTGPARTFQVGLKYSF